MSFSSDIKDELIRVDYEKKCCRKAEIAAILRTGLILRKTKRRKTLTFITEHGLLSRYLYTQIKHIVKKGPEIYGEKTPRLKKHVVYRIDFNNLLENDEQRSFLEDIGIFLDLDKGTIEYHKYDIEDRCCIRSYLRGGFLSVGSLTNPDKSYHLELNFQNKLIQTEYMGYMEYFDLKPKHITRKNYEIVYLKEGQDIVDYLNVIGAHNALMEMENVRIMKEMRNQVNRIVNCETANLEKTVNAAVNQVEYIKYIDSVMGIENLPPALREIARLRLENTHASLSELGKMLSPELSKSGVNHRLRKLEKIAENLRRGKP
ncbi:MAG: DNA-binding protein WhiA [Clostridiaceae bacterium]|nr:DNA-binding protein WhiA [Clostridiaceae bacterium]